MAHPAPSALFPTIHHPRKRAFLRVYAAIGQVVKACRAAQVDHSQHYYWLRTDPDYAHAFAEAKCMVGDMLEEEAIRRALGYEETHYTATGTAYQIRKHSDILLIFLLKGAMPEKYGERVAHTGAKSAPLGITVVYEERLSAPPGSVVPIIPHP